MTTTKTNEQRLADLEREVTAMKKQIAAMRPPSTPSVITGPAVARDEELDREHGDPVIRKDPPRWSGPSYIGQHYSQCPADYLESLAGFLDWKAGKTEQEGDPDRRKYIAYDRKDASRARGWARRNAGAVHVQAPGEQTYDASGEPEALPF